MTHVKESDLARAAQNVVYDIIAGTPCYAHGLKIQHDEGALHFREIGHWSRSRKDRLYGGEARCEGDDADLHG
jgi:hypothetical protein